MPPEQLPAWTLNYLLDAEYIPRRLNLKPASAEQIRYTLVSFGRYIRHIPTVADLTEMNLLRWLAQRRLEVSPSTVKRDRGNLLTLWTFAWRRGWATRPPEVEPIRLPPRIPRAMSLDDVSAILRVTSRLRGLMRNHNILRCDWYSSLVLFLYDTGARITASLEVPPHDIDLAARHVLMAAQHSKTGIEQLVTLSEQTVAAIAKLYDPTASPAARSQAKVIYGHFGLWPRGISPVIDVP